MVFPLITKMEDQAKCVEPINENVYLAFNFPTALIIKADDD